MLTTDSVDAVDPAALIEACMERGLLVNCTQGNVIRLLPAMTLTESQASDGCDILVDVVKQLQP